MKINFSKYQATGNDFVVINGDRESVPIDAESLGLLCHRRFGIGADGLIIVNSDPQYDFRVEYYNPDGSKSFCGNGTRSAIHFAHKEGFISNKTTEFSAFDGIHQAEILDTQNIRVSIGDVHNVRLLEDGTFVDTGSPHLVRFVHDIESVDVMGVGRRLRHEAPIEGGTNVNFVHMESPSLLNIRTYERGVENETYSCGTGVTASAIAAADKGAVSPVILKAKGGELLVEFKKTDGVGFTDIYLTGPAECVFKGTYES